VWRISTTHVNVVAQALERKDSGLASDVSVGNMGLYAEHPLIHGSTQRRRREDTADRECNPGIPDRVEGSHDESWTGNEKDENPERV